MLKKTKPTSAPIKKSSVTPGTSHQLNSLVQGTVIEGKISSESDIRVDGTIKGNLYCKAKVILGPTGYIDGEIKCQNAVIEGRVQGTLDVAELLNVRESAEINGDVMTKKLIVQSGAVFNVHCKMGMQSQKGQPKPATKVKSTTGESQRLAKEAS